MRLVANLRVTEQRTQCLLLQREKSSIELKAAGLIRCAGPGIESVGASELHVRHAGDHAPDVDRSLIRWRVAGRVDQPDVRGQREDDSDQTVLSQVAIVRRLFAVDAEVVGVDRPEQRIVGLVVVSTPLLQPLESCLHCRRRQPELFRDHVAVGAGAAITVQSTQVAIEKGDQPAQYSSARFAAALTVGVVAGCRRVGPRQGARQRYIDKECQMQRCQLSRCLMASLQMTFGPDCAAQSVEESLAQR